jgi:hypothetical protein
MKRWRACVTAATAVGAVAVLAAAGAIQVTPVVSEGQVSASFAAPSTFGEDIRTAVRSGLVVTFTYSLELRRPSTVWFDHTIGASTVASAVKFDNLTSVYQVSKAQDGHITWSERTQEDARVRAWMTSFERVPITASERLEVNAEYYVRVRLQASPKLTFSLVPWSADTASGRADFTFIR